MIINRIYESQTSVAVAFPFLVGLRTYQHPCNDAEGTCELVTLNESAIRGTTCVRNISVSCNRLICISAITGLS